MTCLWALYGTYKNDPSEAFRALNVTRVELAFLQSLYRHEEGKNTLKLAYLRKVVLFLESEIDLLKLTFRQSPQSPADPPSDKSQVCFVPKSSSLGIDSMGEFALSFELSRQFLDAQGRPTQVGWIKAILFFLLTLALAVYQFFIFSACWMI